MSPVQIICIVPALLWSLFLSLPLRAEAAKIPDPSSAETTLQALLVRVGEVEVLCLQDRQVEMPASLFPHTDPALLKRHMPSGLAPATISVFAVRQKGAVTLVDAGYGTAGPGASSLTTSMQTLGVTPEEVSQILLTHMHMDHIAGLVNNGKRVFPKAVIRVSAPEADYWLSGAPGKGREANFRMAEEVKALYGKDFTPPFAFGENVAPGITALDASGHTPGHTAFLLESGGEKLLFIGDLIHAAALQFPEPAASSAYDMDPSKAAEMRKTYLEMAVRENIRMAGAHLPVPPLVHVKKEGAGFAFFP